MAITTVKGSPVFSIPFQKKTDSVADWGGIANSTYFFDIAANRTYYKDAYGLIHPDNEWTPSEWSSKVAITIEAVTSNPTKATTKQNDYVQFRVLPGNEIEVRYLYSATSGAGGAVGSGNYLWTLPGSFQFDSSVYTFYTGASNDLSGIYSLFGTSNGTFNSLDTYSSQILVMPYDATRFRVMLTGTNYPKDYVSSTRFELNNNNIVQAMNFKFFKA